MDRKSQKNKISRLTPSVDDNFQQSEIYPYFGISYVNNKEYSCTVSLIVSASDDIEIPKVIDFLKDFIPNKLEEFSGQSYLEQFKSVNNKIAEILGDTLEGESFIDVALGYVLLKGEYFYVSLDPDYDLTISRKGKFFSLRNGAKNTVTGSGVIKNSDELFLTFNMSPVLNWKSEETLEVEKSSVPEKDFDEEMSENDEQVDIKLPAREKVESFEDNENIEDIQFPEESEDFNDQEQISENSEPKKSFAERLTPYGEKAKKLSKSLITKLSPKAKSLFENGLKSVGEAVSYIIAVIFRRKKRAGLSKALPNKKKGFLIIAAIIFCVVLLSFIVKTTNEDNQRKLVEQKYRADVAQVGTDISSVEAQSSSIVLGDQMLTAKLSGLLDKVKSVESNNLKDTLGLQKDISGYYTRINSLQDKINGIVRVDEAAVISRFAGFINNPNPSDMVLKDGKLYVTDLNNAKLYSADANSSSAITEVITSGLTKPVSVDFTKQKMLILDQGNGVMDVDLNAKSVKKLPGYDTASQTAIGLQTYQEKDLDNFYLLQPSKKQILRVRNVGGSTFDVGTKYNKDDFTFDASSFTISGGNIYVADTTGNVVKYNAGVKDNFTLPALDIPIGNNARLAGMNPREDGNVYFFIADPANNRILVLDNKASTGNTTFVAQYKPQDDKIFNFKDITSLIVDETGGKIALYALSAYGIFKINVDIR